MKIYDITEQYAFLLNFKYFVCTTSVLTRKTTAPGHHKYSSVL